MAHRVAVANGNWTTAATWKVADATSLLDSQAGTTGSTTAFVSSSTFTPGAITVEGIAVKVGARNSTTGTFSVRLATGGVAVAGTTVTINMSDVGSSANFNAGNTVLGCPLGWYYFLFAAPVTLVAATLYTVQITTSTNGAVSLFRDATAANWARMLITSTTGAPAAGDSMFVIPHWTAAGTSTAYTVTMNETVATDYGSASGTLASFAVGKGCAAEFPTTGANRTRISGIAQLWETGRLSFGTASTPIPTTASAFIEWDCAANDTFGLVNYPSSTLDFNGAARTSGKNVAWCLLNTDEAAAQTVLGVDTDTGWLSGDDVTIGSTTRTATQTEDRVLASDATSTTVTVTVGLTNAHGGTAPSQAEVANFTRNVGMRSTSAFVWFWRDGSDATFTYKWASFATVGGASNGWELGTRAVSEVTRSRTFEFCAVSAIANALEGTNAEGGTMTFTDCVFRASANLNTPGGMIYSTRLNVTVTRCVLLYTGTVANNGVFMVNGTTLTVRNSRFVGCGLNAPNTAYAFGNYFVMDVESCEFHATITNQNAINTGSPDRFAAFRIVDCNFWRCNHPAISMGSSGRGDHLLQGCYFRGNATNHVSMPSGQQAEAVVRFVDCDFESEASFTTGTGVFFGTIWTGRAEFQDCRFSQVSAHTSNDVGRTGTVSDMSLLGVILMNNCLFGAATPVATAVTNNAGGYGRFSYMNEDGVVDAHRTLTQFGTIENQAAVFNTAAPSEQLTPTAAANVGVRGLRSSPVFKPVPAGQSVTFSVWIRRSAAHNGDMPQMIVWANGQGGWTDTRATFVGGTDVWVELTCTVGPATSDSVAEACVEVDGTAGSVYLDDWSASVA